MSRSGHWLRWVGGMTQVHRSFVFLVALALGAGLLISAPAEAASCSVVGKRRVVAGRTEVCTRDGKVRRWVAAPNSRTSKAARAFDVVKPGLPRSTIDRPGPANYDVKFIYATFVDGPDERRDANGTIAGIAADVNRYLTSQFPGHRARYDMYEGLLDVQYVQIPMTNKAFRSYFVDEGWILEDLFQSVLQKAGLNWTHGMNEAKQGHNQRFFFLFVEGYRGVKFGDNSESYEYECTSWDNVWTGLGVRFLRRLDGRECPAQYGYWYPSEISFKKSQSFPSEFNEMCVSKFPGLCRPWGWTLLHQLMNLMMTPTGRPECEYVVKEILSTPTPERPYIKVPENDIWNSGSPFQYPIGHPKLAVFDPARNRYFKMVNGPYAGEKCRDIQYSPMWEKTNG
jgi:hypothetical protein